MKLSTIKDMSDCKSLDLLIANKGSYVYYVELTDELRLSTEKFNSGTLLAVLDKKTKLELGAVTYVGEL